MESSLLEEWSPNAIELPDEIILKVLAYLKTNDLKRCGQVSRRFRNICQDYQESIMESEAYLGWSLNDLPDEVILKVFTFSKTKDLIRCGQVSIRFRNICQDAELWEKINLCCKKIPAAFIQKVLDNDCRYLSLANSRVKGTLDLAKEIYPVKYLDLSNCDASNDTVLEELVGSCYSLQKLSLSKLTLGLHSNMVQNIVQNGFTLKVLNLCSMKQYVRDMAPEEEDLSNPYSYYTKSDFADRKGLVSPLSFESIHLIVTNCPVLTELNLRDTYLSDKSRTFLVNNLTENIEKLDLNYLNMKDRHVITLVNRCKKLTCLNLMGTSITNNSVTSIIENLFGTLIKLGLSNIDMDKLLELRFMKRLSHVVLRK